MKLFWKLFFSLMIVAMAFFSVGGYWMIQSGFRASMEREVSMAYRENEILSDALEQSLDGDPFSIYRREQTKDESYKLLKRITDATIVESSGKMIPYSIKDGKGSVYAGRDLLDASDALVQSLDRTKRGYKITENNGAYYILCASPLEMLDLPFYIESYREITPLFHNRQTQYKSYISLLLLLFLIGAAITLIVSTWLMRPIKKLSKAAMQLSGGRSIQPVPVYSGDEIGQLTQEFNRMADKLAENVEALKDAARRQELFVSSFNHELKTPLTSMIGYADLLRSSRLSEEQAILCANQIVQEGRRLEKLSAMLMELIVLKNQQIQRRPISAGLFLNSVRNTVLPIMEKRQIDFQVSIQEETLFLDPDLMKTVCINLLDNACKAVPDGGRIRLWGIGKEDSYEIIVSDNGCGIPQEELAKVTEAFYMVDKARARAGGGAGLGLAICRQIVEVHNGEMELSSRERHGTKVTVRLKGGDGDEPV